MNYTQTLELGQFEPTDKPKWLVNYNGDMEKIDQNAAKNDERHVNVVASFAAVEVRLEDDEKRLDDAETRLDGLETGMGSQDQKLAVMQSNIDQIHHETVLNTEAIQKLQTGQGAQGSDIATMKQNIASLQGDVGQVERDISTVESNVTALGTQMGVLAGEITTLESDLGTVTADVNTAKQEIVSAQDDISHLDTMYEAQQEDIERLGTAVTANTSSISAVKVDLHEAELDIVRLQTSALHIYISNDGDDNNTGISSDSPIASMEQASVLCSKFGSDAIHFHFIDYVNPHGFTFYLYGKRVLLHGILTISTAAANLIIHCEMLNLSSDLVFENTATSGSTRLGGDGYKLYIENGCTANFGTYNDAYFEFEGCLVIVSSNNLSGNMRLQKISNLTGIGIDTVKTLLKSSHNNLLPGLKASYPNLASITDNYFYSYN